MGLFTDIMGTIASPITAGINAIAGARSQKKANQANRQLAEYQYSKDLEMWNRQNAYNDPMQQMKRMEQAGLNPNMVYGSGAVSGNTAAQLPKYNAPTMQPTFKPIENIPNVISTYQDFQMKQAGINNAKKQGELLEEEKALKRFENQLNAATMDAQVRQRITGADLGGQKFKHLEEYYPQVREEKQIKIDRERGLMPYQLAFAEGKNQYQGVQIQKVLQDLEKGKLGMTKTRLDMERIRQGMTKTQWEIWKTQHGIGLIGDQRDKLEADTELINLKTNWYLEQLFGNMALKGFDVLLKGAGLIRGKGFGKGTRAPSRMSPYDQSNIDHILRNLGKNK